MSVSSLSSQVLWNIGGAQQIFNEGKPILSECINSELWWTLYARPRDDSWIIKAKRSITTQVALQKEGKLNQAQPLSNHATSNPFALFFLYIHYPFFPKTFSCYWWAIVLIALPEAWKYSKYMNGTLNDNNQWSWHDFWKGKIHFKAIFHCIFSVFFGPVAIPMPRGAFSLIYKAWSTEQSSSFKSSV